MRRRRHHEWYRYGDERFREIKIKISKVYGNALRTARFDEINAMKAQSIATTIYTILIRMCRKYFRDLWMECYWDEYEDLIEDERLEREAWTAERINARLDRLLGGFDPVTKYIYEQEVERKRSRFFESIVADAERKNRREFENDFRRAEKLWIRQTRQWFIEVEDAARKDALRDANRAGRVRGFNEDGARVPPNEVKQTKDPLVMWLTQGDERVCPDCQPLDGLVFRLSDLPDKHFGCRCVWIPWANKK